MLQNPLQDYSVIQNIHDKINTFFLHVHVSIGLTFKTVFYGESDVINLKFDNE